MLSASTSQTGAPPSRELDQLAPFVRNSADGERELVTARLGHGPPQYGGQPVTNIRNVMSPHSGDGWGRRSAASCPRHREYADTKPRKTPTGLR